MKSEGLSKELDAYAIAIRNHFLAWQCRQRQFLIRQDAGRPSPAIRPRVLVNNESLAQIIVIFNKLNSTIITQEFRHMVLKTNDPADRYHAALKKLAAAHYQHPQEFSDCLTALFSAGSTLANQLLCANACELEFDYQSQYYRFLCRIENLPEHHTDYQATYWHNRLFNPAMPSGVRVLQFIPNWNHAKANPLPNELASQ